MNHSCACAEEIFHCLFATCAFKRAFSCLCTTPEFPFFPVDLCEKNGIPYVNTGKLIVATSEQEVSALSKVLVCSYSIASVSECSFVLLRSSRLGRKSQEYVDQGQAGNLQSIVLVRLLIAFALLDTQNAFGFDG